MSRVVVVTGGASGIGRALCRAFAAAGDTVVVADLDAGGAERVAAEIGGEAVAVDVRDAEAMEALVAGAVARHGRIDVIVNNAGIGVGGRTEELTVAHWDRVIDVNLRGVVHGVAAAYPRMIEQRSGQIVNVASLAGLIPAPMLAPYAATKHAVVGLSLALRVEAAGFGVGVTCVCPGFTDTPILDSTGPDDLPTTSMAGATRAIASAGGKLYDPDLLAADVLRGIARDDAFVVAPRSARMMWRMMRISPSFMLRETTRQAAAIRRRLEKAAAAAGERATTSKGA